MQSTKYTTFLLLAVVLLFAIACGPVPKPKNAFESAPDLLMEMSRIRDRIQSFRMAGTVDHLGEQRVKGNTFMFAKLPDKLRIDVLSPFGNTLAVLTADGEQFGLSDHRQGQYMKGPAEPCNIARLIGIALPPQEIIGLLIGRVPIIDGDAQIDWNKKGHYDVTISSEDYTQTLAVDPDRDILSVQRSTLSDEDGLIYDISYNMWRNTSGEYLPYEIDVEMPRDKTHMLIRYETDGAEINVELPEDAWTQKFPAGATVESVDCQ